MEGRDTSTCLCLLRHMHVLVSACFDSAETNLVDLFRRGGYRIGTRFIKRDISMVNWGLAELTRYFILAEKLVPKGKIFEHCSVSGGTRSR